MFVRRCSVPATLSSSRVSIRLAGLRHAWVGAAAAIALGLVTGCAVGPDFKPPAAPEAAGYTPGRMPVRTAAASGLDGTAQYFAVDRDIPGEWWTLFHSRPLKTLVERALKNNPDLEAAQAALRVARHNLYAGQGAFFPSVDAGFSATRQRPSIGAPSDDTPQPTFNLFTGQVSVSYTPDVFGLTRRTIESLEAQTDAQRFALEAAYLSLTSNVVVAAVQEASLRGQIAATRQIIKLATDFLVLLRRQRNLGQIPDSDVAAQEASLAQVEQTLPPLQRQLEQQRHLLTALTGQFPNREGAEKFELAALRLPANLPLSLPSRLVEQRPDVRAAEANLHSASALIGAAIANRLPNITLTANTGSTALKLSDLFTPQTAFWSVAGGVVQPIFHGGTLAQRELAARAAYDQAAAQYRSTVIVAFQNVADVLSALKTDAQALQKTVAAERAAYRSLEIMRKRLQLGDVNFLALLNAQQTYQQALLNVVQARANRYADTAALFQALGGGWWNRSDVAPPPPPPPEEEPFMFQ
jgi:NodT family efflux transporter outer membrane factor (OMF) lipoprotein